MSLVFSKNVKKSEVFILNLFAERRGNLKAFFPLIKISILQVTEFLKAALQYQILITGSDYHR